MKSGFSTTVANHFASPIGRRLRRRWRHRVESRFLDPVGCLHHFTRTVHWPRKHTITFGQPPRKAKAENPAKQPPCDGEALARAVSSSDRFMVTHLNTVERLKMRSGSSAARTVDDTHATTANMMTADMRRIELRFMDGINPGDILRLTQAFAPEDAFQCAVRMMIEDKAANLAITKALRASNDPNVALVCQALRERLGDGRAKAQGETLTRRRAQAAERARRYRQRRKALSVTSPISLPSDEC